MDTSSPSENVSFSSDESSRQSITTDCEDLTPPLKRPKKTLIFCAHCDEKVSRATYYRHKVRNQTQISISTLKSNNMGSDTSSSSSSSCTVDHGLEAPELPYDNDRDYTDEYSGTESDDQLQVS